MLGSTPLIPQPTSNNLQISYAPNKSYPKQESPVLQPDGPGEIKLLSMKKIFYSFS